MTHKLFILSITLLGISACGDDEGGTSSLIDRNFALLDENSMYDCECNPSFCFEQDRSASYVQCIKAFAARYSEQVTPLLECSNRSLVEENNCFAEKECTDVTWVECYDVGEDCDNDFTESQKQEIADCGPDLEDAQP